MVAAELQEHINIMFVLEEALKLADIHMLQHSMNRNLHLKLIIRVME